VARERNLRISLIMLAVGALAVVCWWGVARQQVLTSATLQERVQVIATQLRAPGDHNSMTVATSPNVTAQHMRYEIQSALLQGMSSSQVLQEMTSEYGQQVLAAPSFFGFGSLVWVLPWMIVAGIFLIAILFLRKSSAAVTLTHKTSETSKVTSVTHDGVDAMVTKQQIEDRLKDFL